MTTEQKIEVAVQRIVEAEDRRKYFASRFAETGDALYKELAEVETELIGRIRNAITEASLV